MYAVIETGGKQYRVSEGDVVRVERLDGDVGSEVTLEEVRLIGGDDTLVGAPVVEGAAVRATVVEQGKGPKVIAFKKKRRKGYRRKVGHRQPFTALRVDEIVAPGGGTSKSRSKAKTAKAKTAKADDEGEGKPSKKKSAKKSAKKTAAKASGKAKGGSKAASAKSKAKQKKAKAGTGDAGGKDE